MVKGKIFTASFLIAGTAIGAGMLALPVITAPGGFWPAICIYLACWLFSAATGLLLLEACFWLPKDTNIISLSNHLLGKKGKIVSWVLYLFLFYCLTVAYAAGGGGFIKAVSGFSPLLSIFLFVAIFSPVVYIGTHAVDRLNFLLMIGLVVFFIAFVSIGIGKIHFNLLEHINTPVALFSLPVVFTSFSYQGIVPSMRNYFHGEKASVRKVILIGSTVPFFVYVIWEILILGIVPLEGVNGLLEAGSKGLTGVDPLKHFVNSPSVYAVGQAFAFCALTTSFLGVTLGLFDFLADGLKMTKKGGNRKFLYISVFLPPTFIAMLNPHIFLTALRYAGGIGCVLLLGLIPILMVWSGRYRKNLDRKDQQLFGGKPLLVILGIFAIFVLGVTLVTTLR